MAGAGGQHHDIAGLDREVAALVAAELHLRLAAHDAQHLVSCAAWKCRKPWMPLRQELVQPWAANSASYDRRRIAPAWRLERTLQ